MFPPREPHPQHGQGRSRAARAVALALALGACGRDEPDLETGKAQFVEKCGSCHTLDRAGTSGTTGPNLDTAFQAALADGLDRDTVEGIVHRQILHPRVDSQMPAGLVTGQDARDVAAYVGYAAGRKGQDSGRARHRRARAGQDRRADLHGRRLRGLPHVRPGRLDRHDRPEPERAEDPGREIEPGKSAEEYIRESIEDPGAFIVKGFPNVMPSFKGRLTDRR